MLQKRTISFDIIYDDEATQHPEDWDFIELLDLGQETLRNLTVLKADLTVDDVSLFLDENPEGDEDD